MKYILSNSDESYQLIKPVFGEIYKDYAGESWEKSFAEARESSLGLSIIMEESDVKAFCFHREVICDDWQNPPAYISDTPDTFRQQIEKRLRIMTVEWMSVAPKYWGRFSRVQPADLILGVAINFMGLSCFDASMGFSRQDTKVDILTTRFGTKLYGTVYRFGIPCSVVLVEKSGIQRHPIAKTQETVERLLQNRENHLPHLEQRSAA